MIGIIIGLIAGLIAGYLIRRNNPKDPKIIVNADGTSVEFRKARMVVGGYDPNNDRTWVYTEGHPEQGYFVPGKVNVPAGTIYEPVL